MIKSVTEYLDASAKKYPDKIAFANKRSTMTFSRLRNESRKIASYIIKYNAFRRPIAIYLEKSPECVAAFLGVVYSGNYYTPLDTSMPKTRIEKILSTLQPKLIITDRNHYEEVKSFMETVLVVDYEECLRGQVDNSAIDRVVNMVTDADILYILFTSGSTGNPKGVVIPQRSVIDYIEWFTDKFKLSQNDTLGNQAPLYFDLSIQDVYATLKTGCTTYLLEKELFAFPINLMQYLADKRVNIIMWVPSALCLVANLKALRAKQLPKLRMVLFCGEVMPNKHLNQWRQAMPKTLFVNLYGPTETCDASAYFIVDREFADDEPLPIGFPCNNTDIFVLNSENKLVSGDEIGELCIRGTCLAYGYYHEKKKTLAAFVQNPLQDCYPETIYRTGDLVRYNERGEIMYVSRKDFQIKHMGHRIELGEIEIAASSIAGVEQCACIYDDKRKKIVMFYTGAVDKNNILKKIQSMIPEYMVPQNLIQLKIMPLNLNGKIDRTLLKNYKKV